MLQLTGSYAIRLMLLSNVAVVGTVYTALAASTGLVAAPLERPRTHVAKPSQDLPARQFPAIVISVTSRERSIR